MGPRLADNGLVAATRILAREFRGGKLSGQARRVRKLVPALRPLRGAGTVCCRTSQRIADTNGHIRNKNAPTSRDASPPPLIDLSRGAHYGCSPDRRRYVGSDISTAVEIAVGLSG